MGENKYLLTKVNASLVHHVIDTIMQHIPQSVPTLSSDKGLPLDQHTGVKAVPNSANPMARSIFIKEQKPHSFVVSCQVLRKALLLMPTGLWRSNLRLGSRSHAIELQDIGTNIK